MITKQTIQASIAIVTLSFALISFPLVFLIAGQSAANCACGAADQCACAGSAGYAANKRTACGAGAAANKRAFFTITQRLRTAA